MEIHLLISGKVQGVFFRAYTKEKADSLGIKGWVKNRDDGKVEVFLSGPKDKVKQMVYWCWQGSPQSRVDSIEIVKSGKTKKKNWEKFEILY